jgi:hypothetical protein
MHKSYTPEMKLKRRKQDQNSDSQVPVDPFSTQDEHGIRIIELDFESEPEALSDRDTYFRAVSTAALLFPWFGDFHIAPKEGIAYELRQRTIPALRRVLVAYLGGRPMTDAAERVPTSRRTMYKILRGVIYGGRADIDTWTEFGLIRVWDLPEVELYWADFGNGIRFEKDQAAIICLLCHRLIGHTFLHKRLYDSALIEEVDGRIKYGSEEHERIRGHMIAHFHLGGRPWPNEHFDSAFGWWSAIPGATLASRWLDEVDPIVNGIVPTHIGLTAPVMAGRSPTEGRVREYYRELLS